MIKPIGSDITLTNTPAARRTLDVGPSRQQGARPDGAPAHDNRPPDDRAGVARAQQRPAQAAERGPLITDGAQALTALARLRAQLAADPHAALQAHDRVDAALVQSAMARPAI